jgi:hypothetical protein
VEINKQLFRIFTVDIPVVLADVFTQTA